MAADKFRSDSIDPKSLWLFGFKIGEVVNGEIVSLIDELVAPTSTVTESDPRFSRILSACLKPSEGKIGDDDNTGWAP